MNKHLNELIELSQNDQAIDSYTPQLEAADKKVAKIQKKIDAAQGELDTLNADIAGNEERVITFDEHINKWFGSEFQLRRHGYIQEFPHRLLE